MNMLQIFKPGDEIGGYCNGYFGRDDYDNKTCVLVTPKFAVFQNEVDGTGAVINYTPDLIKIDPLNNSNWSPEQ